LATLYLLLEADFVAAAQVIVYAGAVMVMFLFVIAYIGPRGELGRATGPSWQIWAAVVAVSAILVQVALAVGRAGLDEAADVGAREGASGFGSPQAVGELFVTDYLLAFELVSLLLLVAAVAGVILGGGKRPRRAQREDVMEGDAAGTRRGASAAMLEREIAGTRAGGTTRGGGGPGR
jgi:NADH:ubiquinone oxidoreductase subunit 6 (subunit J)